MATEKEKAAFAAKDFDKQMLPTIRKTGTKLREFVQIAMVHAHEEYVQGKRDFDAMARLLNAVYAGFTLRTAKVVASYIKEHGPYAVEFRKDPKTKAERWYVKEDKSEDAVAFDQMKIQWYNWDNGKAKQELKNEEDFLKMIQRVANDKEHKRFNAKAVAVANKTLTFLTEETQADNIAA